MELLPNPVSESGHTPYWVSRIETGYYNNFCPITSFAQNLSALFDKLLKGTGNGSVYSQFTYVMNDQMVFNCAMFSD